MSVQPAPTTPTYDLGGTRFTSLATPSRGGTTDTSVWIVDIDQDVPSSPHSVTREEVFVVLHGRARVTIEGITSIADTGDVVVVPPRRLFEIANPDPEPLRMLSLLPVGGQAVTVDDTFTPPWAL